MNLSLTNTNKNTMRFFLLLMAIGLLSCNLNSNSEYNQVVNAIPNSIEIEQNKHIGLFLYSPGGCLPCNGILSNMLNNQDYFKIVGNNSFLVFPSIRESELKDYDQTLKEYGSVNIQYINDAKLYNLLKLKNKETLGGKPKWIGLNVKDKKCFVLELKNAYLLDSIKKYF
jgi:hypothetical protein